MSTITKCLNEWNATVEALGQAKQTILIRKYNTNLKEFLLYPTTSYALKDDYLDSFTNKDFAKANALPKKEDNKTEVKYYANVEKEVSLNNIKPVLSDKDFDNLLDGELNG